MSSFYPNGTYVIGSISGRRNLTPATIAKITLENGQITYCSAPFIKMSMQFLINTKACCVDEQDPAFDYMLVSVQIKV